MWLQRSSSTWFASPWEDEFQIATKQRTADFTYISYWDMGCLSQTLAASTNWINFYNPHFAAYFLYPFVFISSSWATHPFSFALQRKNHLGCISQFPLDGENPWNFLSVNGQSTAINPIKSLTFDRFSGKWRATANQFLPAKIQNRWRTPMRSTNTQRSAWEPCSSSWVAQPRPRQLDMFLLGWTSPKMSHQKTCDINKIGVKSHEVYIINYPRVKDGRWWNSMKFSLFLKFKGDLSMWETQ